jgi:hypothetical protein
MIAGNMPTKTTIQFDYIDQYPPPFKQSNEDKILLISPYQIQTLDKHINYKPPELKCSKLIINLSKDNYLDNENLDNLIVTDGTQEIVLILDPTLLTIEKISQVIASWKVSKISHKNVVLSILVPKGTSKFNEKINFCLWKNENASCIIKKHLINPIWYPSLNKNRQTLLKMIEDFQPYDVFPLIEFPSFATEMGENTLTNHSEMLEKTRTRTRNFIYFDIRHPKRAFNHFFGVIKAFPTLTTPIFSPVITPGGTNKGYLISLIAGVLSDSSFYTVQNEIPIPSNCEIEGIITLRKIV